jgi:hypothetical protein
MLHDCKWKTPSARTEMKTSLQTRIFNGSGLQIEGVVAYFTHLECQKRIGDDVGDLKYVLSTLLCKNMTPNALK